MEMCSLFFFFSGSIEFAYFKKEIWAIPIVAFAQWVKKLKESTRMLVQSLATISGLRMQHCFRVYQTSKMCLRTNVVMAVAQANTWSSDLTPSSGTSICQCGCEKKKRERKRDDLIVCLLAIFRACLSCFYLFGHISS